MKPTQYRDQYTRRFTRIAGPAMWGVCSETIRFHAFWLASHEGVAATCPKPLALIIKIPQHAGTRFERGSY